MKRIFILALLSASFIGSALAQGEMDAFNLSYNGLKGTARSVAMGGAFGALGGDISGIAVNPAGIGVYTTSEIVTTMNFTNTRTKTNLYDSSTKDSKFKFSFDNLAFVGTVPLHSDVAPLINFGFSYNRLQSFDRKVTMSGHFLDHSQSDYFVGRVNGIPEADLKLDADPFFDRSSDYWLGALAYGTGIIKPKTAGGDQYQSILNDMNNPTIDNYQHVYERGSIDSYDFNVGTTFADMLSAGLTISVTDIGYSIYSLYSEAYYEGNNTTPAAEYDFENWMRTDGTGWQVKAGLIFKPIQELRMGIAYHSPTWYDMTDFYSVRMDAFNGRPAVDSFNEEGNVYSNYKLHTPDKWVFSLAGVIGQTAIISADYELTNYNKMKLNDSNGRGLSANQDIKESFRNSSTLRVGAEIRFTPQFSGRVGYMWQQSPVKDILVNGSADGSHPAFIAGTITHYSLVGDSHYFTYGLGYRFTPQFYTDVAFVMNNRTDDWYSFAGSDRAELKTNMFSGLLTLGYRF